MRPSVTEQLEGLRRILEEVIAPELDDAYPRDILAGVCATLESISDGWQRVPAFLDWDARASMALVARVSEVELSQSVDPLDIAALEVRHRDSRAALETAIPEIAEREDLRELRNELVDLFREREKRYPLKTVWRR